MPQQYIDQPQLDPEGMPMPGAQAGMDRREALFRQGTNPNTNEPLLAAIDASMQDQAAAAPARRAPSPQRRPQALPAEDPISGGQTNRYGQGQTAPLPPRRPAEAGVQPRDQVAAPPSRSGVNPDTRNIIELILGALGITGLGAAAVKGGQYALDRARGTERPGKPQVATGYEQETKPATGYEQSRQPTGYESSEPPRQPTGYEQPEKPENRAPGGRPVSKVKPADEDVVGGVIDRSMEESPAQAKYRAEHAAAMKAGEEGYPDEAKRSKSGPPSRPVSKVPSGKRAPRAPTKIKLK